jgi:hypothetical protein
MKLIKTFIIFLCVFTFSIRLNAQLFLAAAYTAGTSKYPTFNLLVENYNKYNENLLSKKLTGFGLTNGAYLSLNYTGKKYSLYEVGYHRSYGTAIAEFLNGDKRYFHSMSSYWDFFMGSNFNLKKLKIGLIFGGFRGRMYIDSYYKYENGVCDYSIGKLLNGEYRGTYMGVMAGLKFTYAVRENIWLMLRAERLWQLLSDDLMDKEASRSYEEHVTPYLPTDYEHYSEIYGANLRLPPNYRVKSDYKPFNFSLGIQYTIAKH